MDASRFIQTFDRNLSRAECDHLIEKFHDPFHQRTADGSWSEVTIEPPMIASALAPLVDYYNAKVGLTLPVLSSKSSEVFRIKRYRPGTGEEFRVHHDAKGFYCNRYLVLLWYLNDVAEGGETWFPDLEVAIKPKVGRLLMFPPYWMFQHEGLRPVSNDKYILSTYLLY